MSIIDNFDWDEEDDTDESLRPGGFEDSVADVVAAEEAEERAELGLDDDDFLCHECGEALDRCTCDDDDDEDEEGEDDSVSP